MRNQHRCSPCAQSAPGCSSAISELWEHTPVDTNRRRSPNSSETAESRVKTEIRSRSMPNGLYRQTWRGKTGNRPLSVSIAKKSKRTESPTSPLLTFNFCAPPPGQASRGRPKTPPQPCLGMAALRRQKQPRSKVENQIARHGKLIMPSTVVICLVIPGALETQFRTQLDRCADPMTPHDCVL